MTIVTNVPTGFVVPTTFNVFNYLRAAGSLISVPLTVAIVGTMSSAGTGVVGQVYDADDATITDALAGINSEAAIMCRQAYLCSRVNERGPRVKLTLIAEPGGGTAAVRTITCVGTATTDGNQIVKVAGRTFSIGVRSGNNASTNAAAIAAALNAKAEELPVVVTVLAGVVTLTHPTKGENGNDVIISVEQQVAGIVATAATGTAGAGVSDITAGLNALAPLRYDGICTANHKSADITAILLDVATRWSSASKKWGWYFLWERGTIGTATALAAAANHRAVLVGSGEGFLSAPGEGAVTMAMLVFSREKANAGFDGAIVPLFPPNQTTWYTDDEQNTAILAGLAPFIGITDSSGAVTENRAACVQMVTSKTTIGSAPDDRNRDIGVSRAGVHLALQLYYASQIALGADNNPDGVSVEDSEPLILDLASAILRAEARAGVISKRFVETDVAGIRQEDDATVLGRKNVKLPYHVQIILHQVVWVHDIIVGLGA